MTETTSLKSLCLKVRCEATYGASKDWNKLDEWQRNANGYTVILRYKGRQMTLDFWQGQGITHEPTAEGVLECLLSDASSADESFENWASEYGYDTDSRKAEATYNAVQNQTAKLKRLLGDDFDTFLYAERD